MAIKKIKTLSLFSGAGGLDIGFHEAGFEVVACVEIEPAYCQTLEANKGRGKVFSANTAIHCVDIRHFDPTPYAGQGIECVIGGPPCQTFSAAGRRSGGVLGTIDERGRLFESYRRILEVIKPKAFVFENVYGLSGANAGGPWREICESFSEIGYNLRAEIVDAADYGVSQHRERLIIVGFAGKDARFEFPMPTHGPDSRNGQPLFSVGEAIADLQVEGESPSKLGGLYGHLLPMVPEGLNYSFFTREMGYPRPYFAWRSKFSDFLYKADRNLPCRTLKAHPGKFTGPFHWNNRHFNVDELKRLQSFPDNYQVLGTYGKAMEQIGNSVPPRLAFVIATSVKQQLLRPSKTLRFAKRPPDFSSTFRQRQRDRTQYYKSIAEREISLRFPNVSVLPTHAEVNKDQIQYFVGFEDFFTKEVYAERPPFRLGWSYYQVTEIRRDAGIELDIARLSGPRSSLKQVSIEITGLSKYLIVIDRLYCTASQDVPEDLFRIWSIIESALTKDSQFFTLIDIFGHYANRGDTVRISTKYAKRRMQPIERAIQYVGNSANCGNFLSMEETAMAVGVNTAKLADIIKQLRSIRWDIRTPETHATIRQQAILCTYPFPLLSDKAQLERRANGQ